MILSLFHKKIRIILLETIFNLKNNTFTIYIMSVKSDYSDQSDQSDNSDEESETCNLCCSSMTIEDTHDSICTDCLDLVIRIWTCERCCNTWSPDFCDEGIYSDCCHPLMESDYTNFDEFHYCYETGETLFPKETCCIGCEDSGSEDDDSDDRESSSECETRIKAYTRSSCKLREYINFTN